jgi:LysM repeat protein
MPRDIGNEITVALVVVAVLVFALTFGIILSLSNIPAQDDPVTEVAQAPSATLTDRAEDPTVTLSPSPEPTATASLTVTASPTPSPTETVRPTRVRSSQTPRPTLTPQPPTVTATATATLTRTPRPSATLPPTKTPEPTATITPSWTPTLTPTPTMVWASVTPVIGTPVGYGLCERPLGWVGYQVEPGMNLSTIARAVGSSVMELQASNCLADADAVYTGQVLSVPTFGSANRPGIGVIDDAQDHCPDPDSMMVLRPWSEGEPAVLALWGTAIGEDFAYYKVEIRPQHVVLYDFVASGNVPVKDGLLALVDTGRYAPGDYWLRLSVVGADGRLSADACSLWVTVGS